MYESTPEGEEVDSYLALVPSVLRSGETSSFSFTLYKGERPAKSQVTVSVHGPDETVAMTTGTVKGKGTLALDIPDVSPGEYKVKVETSGFSKTGTVQIRPGNVAKTQT